MRPKSLLWFDRLFLGEFMLGIIGGVITEAEMRHALAADPGLSDSVIFVENLAVMGALLLIWYFISRRASKIAKWLLVVFMLWGLISLPNGLRMMGKFSMLWSAILVINTLLQLAAVTCLFRPDARTWFAAKGKPLDPAIFD